MGADATVKTYRARRRVKIAPDVWREPGELVPEAHGWFRAQSWLHTGWLIEDTVTEADFAAALTAFCPDQVDSLSHLAGVGDVTLHGTENSPQLAPTTRRAPRRTKAADAKASAASAE